MGLMEWGGLGALVLGLIVFCAKLMRNGLTTLDDHRSHYLDNIRQEKKRIADDVKNMSAAEHMQVVHAAVRDLLRLDDNPQGFSVNCQGRRIFLQTPNENWQIELLMVERRLKGSKKVLHGRGRWRLSGSTYSEDFSDLTALMRTLNFKLHPDAEILPEETGLPSHRPISRPQHLPR